MGSVSRPKRLGMLTACGTRPTARNRQASTIGRVSPPLREVTFATVGREIYFQHPDGTWEGDLRPDQIVLEKVLRLDPLRARINSAAARAAKDAGRVVKLRGVHASAPVFAGTRIRVSTVQDYLRNGYDTDAILTAFPDLTAADVDEASGCSALPGSALPPRSRCRRRCGTDAAALAVAL